MKRARIAVLCLVALPAMACNDGGETGAQPSPSTASPSASPTFRDSIALLEGDRGPVLVEVEVAETEEERQFGLMFRESLDEDAGMVFVFFEESSGGFWMKNTRIPLSIAYFDEDGKILRIMDMKPCREDPCPVYDPGVSYYGALEVNRGAFERWGIEEGDVFRMTQ